MLRSRPSWMATPFLCVGLCSAAEVTQATFASPALAIDKHLTVILPRGYDATSTTRYPVAYFLDGYAGSDSRWAQKTTLPALVDQYGIIAACPDGTADSWYIDSPIHPEHRYETFIFQDVIAYVDGHYRTRAAPAGRGITGLSMGGHGAMFVGLRHPDVFGAVAAMSGGLDIRPFAKQWNIKTWLGDIDTHRADWDSHSVINVLDRVQPGRQAILFDCGTADFFLEVNRKAHERLVALKVPHTYEEYPGKHDWTYWEAAVVRHMAFFDRTFRDAPPKP